MKMKCITVRYDDNCADLFVPDDWTVHTIVELVHKELCQWMHDNPIHLSTEGNDGAFGTCPNCKQSVPKYTTTISPIKFCPHCSQALKWDK